MNDHGMNRKWLLAGLIGAMITVVGEMLQGAVPSADTADKMSRLFSSFAHLSAWRIGLGSTVGALGILMQFFGMYGIFLAFDDASCWTARVYHAGMYVFSVVGAIVHVLMSVLVYVYKLDAGLMMEFTLWFCLPIVVLFFAGYISFSIAMALQFWKRRTAYPRWMFLLNPLFGKGFFAAVTALLPCSALVNGISYSNMGLSSTILFSALLLSGAGQKSAKH